VAVCVGTLGRAPAHAWRHALERVTARLEVAVGMLVPDPAKQAAGVAVAVGMEQLAHAYRKCTNGRAIQSGRATPTSAIGIHS